MKRNLWTYLAALAFACVCQLSVAAAQEVQQGYLETEPQGGYQSEAQYDQSVYQTGMFSEALAGNCTSDCSGDCSTVCDDACEQPRCRTFTGMAEVPFLTPHTGSIWVTALGGQITPDFDAQVSSRFVLGVENQEGLGVRMRYWLFDHTSGSTNPGGIAFITQDLKAQTLDFETTQTTEFRHWQMMWFGGMRYANQRYSLGINPGAPGSLDVKFEGVGPTLGLSTLRPVGTGRVSLYGGLRGSLIFGDTRLGGTGILAAAVNGAGVRVNEHVMQIWDINMGIQYGHGPLFARLGYEAQVWDSGLPIVNFDVGYAGPTIALGFIR